MTAGLLPEPLVKLTALPRSIAAFGLGKEGNRKEGRKKAAIVLNMYYISKPIMCVLKLVTRHQANVVLSRSGDL